MWQTVRGEGGPGREDLPPASSVRQENDLSELMPDELAVLVFIVPVPWNLPQWRASYGRKLEKVTHQDHHG
jgi:hypothetical protein